MCRSHIQNKSDESELQEGVRKESLQTNKQNVLTPSRGGPVLQLKSLLSCHQMSRLASLHEYWSCIKAVPTSTFLLLLLQTFLVNVKSDVGHTWSGWAYLTGVEVLL